MDREVRSRVCVWKSVAEKERERGQGVLARKKGMDGLFHFEKTKERGLCGGVS